MRDSKKLKKAEKVSKAGLSNIWIPRMRDFAPECEILASVQRPVCSEGGKVFESAAEWGCPCSPRFPMSNIMTGYNQNQKHFKNTAAG